MEPFKVKMTGDFVTLKAGDVVEVTKHKNKRVYVLEGKISCTLGEIKYIPKVLTEPVV